MTLRELLTNLNSRGIDTTILVKYYQRKFNNLANFKKQQLKIHSFKDFKLISINQKVLESIIFALETFLKPYFDYCEFSRLVCKKILRFEYVTHCIGLTTHSNSPELNVRTFATPCEDLPEYLIVEVTSQGAVRFSNRFGVQPTLIRY